MLRQCSQRRQRFPRHHLRLRPRPHLLPRPLRQPPPESKAEAVLGREDAPSNNYPEVDLGPHGALQEGVGRRHARMFVLAGQVQIEDLESTNGTIVNRQKLPPRQGRVVNVGDEIRLGKLVLTLQR